MAWETKTLREIECGAKVFAVQKSIDVEEGQVQARTIGVRMFVVKKSGDLAVTKTGISFNLADKEKALEEAKAMHKALGLIIKHLDK